MKRWIKWTVVLLVIAVLALSAVRVLSARRSQKAELEAQQLAAKAQTVVELTSADLVEVKTLDLSQSLALSGSIKAVNSAFVKARVPGELQSLAVREGDWVKTGDIIARVDSTEYQSRVRQAQQLAEAAKAQVDIAKRSYDNNRSLVDQGFISKTALEASQANLAAAEANFRAAQAGAEVAVKSLEDVVLRAPISGQISQRLAQSGERVSVDARIVEVVDLSRIEMEASISAADSLNVRVGQSAQVTIEGTEATLPARVVRLNPSAVAGSRAVLIYLSLAPNAALRQGLFAQGVLATGTMHSKAVPLSAVRTDKPQPYVQWVSDEQVLHQTVTLGARGEYGAQTWIAVEGIAEGARVLGGGVGALRAGTLVTLPQAVK
jgi:RND family efflux transporter MFP subunit